MSKMPVHRALGLTGLAFAAAIGAGAAAASPMAGATSETHAPMTAANTKPTETRPYLPRTGADFARLLKGCTDDSCLSYMSGAINGMGVYAYLVGKPSPFCAPKDVDSEKVRDIVLSAIDKNPKLQSSPPAIAILAAFSETWPCKADPTQAADQTHADESAGENDVLGISDTKPAPLADLSAFVSGNTSALSMGPADAPAEKTLVVLSDPNCPHCDRFKPELDQLVAQGWHVTIYPVSVIAKESKGYAAVEIAVRDNKKAAAALYHHDGNGKADIKSAIGIATSNGLDEGVILEAIASGKGLCCGRSQQPLLRQGRRQGHAAVVPRRQDAGRLRDRDRPDPALNRTESAVRNRHILPSRDAPGRDLGGRQLMRLTVQTADLVRIVGRAEPMSTKANGLLITALATDDASGQGTVAVLAFAGSTVSRWVCAAQVKEPGQIVVRGDTLEKFLKATVKSDTTIGLETIDTDNRDSLRITTSRGAHELDGLPEKAFDRLNPGQVDGPMADMRRLADAISMATNFSASAQEANGTRLALSGVHIRKGSSIDVVATDGHRMVQVELDPGLSDALLLPEEGGITIPGTMATRIAALLSEEDARIGAANGNLVLETPSGALAIQCIDAAYYDYSPALTTRNEHRISLSKTHFALALARCSAKVANEDRYNAATLECGPDGTRLLSFTSQDSSSELISETSGDACEVSFNATYMHRALNLLPGERVSLDFTDHNRPMLLRSEDHSNIIMLIMPCRPPARR